MFMPNRRPMKPRDRRRAACVRVAVVLVTVMAVEAGVLAGLIR